MLIYRQKMRLLYNDYLKVNHRTNFNAKTIKIYTKAKLNIHEFRFGNGAFGCKNKFNKNV